MFALLLLLFLDFSFSTSFYENPKKRVAIALSGQVREYRQTHRLLFQKLIEKNAHLASFDFFIYASPEPVRGKIINQTNLLEIYKPIQWKFDQLNHSSFVSVLYPRVAGFMSQVHKVGECFKMIADYENDHNFRYDYVLRLRFDIMFLDDIDLGKWMNYPCVNCVFLLMECRSSWCPPSMHQLTKWKEEMDRGVFSIVCGEATVIFDGVYLSDSIAARHLIELTKWTIPGPACPESAMFEIFSIHNTVAYQNTELWWHTGNRIIVRHLWEQKFYHIDQECLAVLESCWNQDCIWDPAISDRHCKTTKS